MAPEDIKTVHMVRCPFCKSYHRVDVKVTTFGIWPTSEGLPSIEELLVSKPTICPFTNQSFDSDEDDWLHLTEEEFHERYPGHRSI